MVDLYINGEKIETTSMTFEPNCNILDGRLMKMKNPTLKLELNDSELLNLKHIVDLLKDANK